MTNKWTLAVKEPFNYRECLIFLNRAKAECLYKVEENYVYRLLRLGRNWILLRLGYENRKLTIQTTPGVNTDEQSQINQYIDTWLDVSRDIEPFYKQVIEDPLLREHIQKFRGLRLIGIPDLFESLCWAILGQQINLAFAYRLKQRLVEAAGYKVKMEGEFYYHFPSPSDLIAIPQEQMREMQISGRKAEYLHGIAEQMNSGQLSMQVLRNKESSEEIAKTLTAIRGIGDWTAQYVMMKSLQIPSAFPAGDAGLHQALKKQLGMERKPSMEEIREIAKAWQGWEAYATLYLWRSLYEPPKS